MPTPVYWIPTSFPGRLAVAPRPRGGDWLDDELRDWRSRGFDLVVSLLEYQEVRDFDLGEELSLSETNGMGFLSFPIPDRGTPDSPDAFRELVALLSDELDAGGSVLIHCRQGIGRSGLLAASLLAAAGVSRSEAARVVSQARGVTVPETDVQRHFLDSFQPAAAEAFKRAGTP